MSLSLDIRREFPLRRGLTVRVLDLLSGRAAVARELAGLHLFLHEGGAPAPHGRAAEVFAAIVHALDARPALVVSDRYLRLFGERAADSGHAAKRGKGVSSFRTRGDAADLQWVLEEFLTEPPSIFFGDAPEAPTSGQLHRLSGLLPRVRFLAEPALFRSHLALYCHTAARADELAEGVRRFCEARGIGLDGG